MSFPTKTKLCAAAGVSLAAIGITPLAVASSHDAPSHVVKVHAVTPAEPTTLIVAPADVAGDSRLTLYASLVGTRTGQPVSGRRIAFSTGGSPLCVGTTDAHGVARCSIAGLAQPVQFPATVTSLRHLTSTHPTLTGTFAGAAGNLPSRGIAVL